ncbi:hypothetical protein ABUW04_19155 [Streptacidiphilus sp. N1-10]|uniref:Uncharacterized protein n=1 Tax=Streptacidiphilus jeojiensis TaxID=3229225 RepID=A0ABV6XQ48_9ACTN
MLCNLPGINPVTINQTIGETRRLLHEKRISVGQNTLDLSRSQNLRDWFDHGLAPVVFLPASEALAHPILTGMSRQEFRTLVEKISVA